MAAAPLALSRNEILQRVGNLAQLGGTRHAILKDGAAKGVAAIADFGRFSAPVPQFQEQNFLHQMVPAEDGLAHAAMLNPTLAGGLGLALAFDPAQLPYLNEWKMMGQRDYVVGIEPCNAPCANRALLRQAGLLPLLEPGQALEFALEFRVLDGQDELADHRGRYGFAPAVERFTSL